MESKLRGQYFFCLFRVGINRTFMELKRLADELVTRHNLRINRTFMELKHIEGFTLKKFQVY